MNKDYVEGSFRSAVGQGEKLVGQATNDPGMTGRGASDDIAGKAQSALGSAKDAVNRGADAVAAVDFSGLRDELAKLTQTVADLAQKHVSSGGDQVVGAMGAASDSLAQSAAVAQDK